MVIVNSWRIHVSIPTMPTLQGYIQGYAINLDHEGAINAHMTSL